jgi:benzil reductase ((S)-benzoin forming)
MSRRLAIVTGASRGLGRAVAQQLADGGWQVLGISRRRDDALEGRIEQWTADLADAPAIASRLQAWLHTLDGSAYGETALIHNAALLVPPGPAEAADDATTSAALRVGLEAPLLMSAAFLRATRAWPGTRKLLFVSSGLGRRAMAGAAVYCATKAGLDHYARALALDEAQHGARGARVVSLAPGVIDTDMQRQLRGSDPARFVEQQRFAQLHREGQLASPEAAARQLIAYLVRADFGSQPVADVRDPA